MIIHGQLTIARGETAVHSPASFNRSLGLDTLTFPSLKLGVSHSVCACGNGQCYAQFDSKKGRVTLSPLGEILYVFG